LALPEGLLCEARPNPATRGDGIRIRIDTRIQGRCSLAVFDIAGREVGAFRKNLDVLPGMSEVVLEPEGLFGRRLTTGVYFAVVESVGGVRSAARMVVIR
jgi:hypothetical protein